MSWYSDLLRETATYWSPPSRDGYGGYVWSSPSTILSKWEEVSNLIYASDGSHIVSSTVVYLSIDVVIGGYLYAGSTLLSPPEAARQIISIDTIKSLREQTIICYKAFLR